MKVKLLRKVRQRYLITHYPNGVLLYKTFYEGPITLLTDKADSWRLKSSFLPKNRAYTELCKHMIGWIRNDYPQQSRNRQTRLKSEVLWYNPDKK